MNDFNNANNKSNMIKNMENNDSAKNANLDKSAKAKHLKRIMLVATVIIVAIFALYVSNAHSKYNITTTISANSSATTSTAPQKINPVEYITANAFINGYNFTSPLKYSSRAVFNPYTADANCTGLEGVLSYMQNSTMIHSAYNLSKLNKSEPIAEYAAVEGINPSYSTGYKATFESNRGFCRPAISIVVSESSVYRSTYSHGNTTVYFFTISNMSANATEQFGSYLGPKPNITVYMAEAMYGNYIVKAVSAGFSPTTSVGALGLDAYTMNLMNTTLDSFENYIANHQNATK